MELYERSHFRDNKSYEEYLEKIRQGKHYKAYKMFADKLFEEFGLTSSQIEEIINFVDLMMDDRRAYHYQWYSDDAKRWYSDDAKRAIELVIMETDMRT